MALFRVLLGLYLIADLFRRARDLLAHYTDFGVMPRSVAVDFLSPSSLSIHLANGSAEFQAALFGVAGIAALMLVFGWHTRLATFVSWFLLLSLQNRNTVILSGEDNLALLLLFWAMFLPLGARYSIDSSLDPSNGSNQNRHVSVWSAALLIQGMSMYFFSALLKSDPIWMPDGTGGLLCLEPRLFRDPFRSLVPPVRNAASRSHILRLVLGTDRAGSYVFPFFSKGFAASIDALFHYNAHRLLDVPRNRAFPGHLDHHESDLHTRVGFGTASSIAWQGWRSAV